MTIHRFPFLNRTRKNAAAARLIQEECDLLAGPATRGDLGAALAAIVLLYTPADIRQMQRNFKTKIRDIDEEYREPLYLKVTEHLLGTYQQIRLLSQQGAFSRMDTPVSPENGRYWAMVSAACSARAEEKDPRLAFLNYLLAGFCMFVLQEPAHPVGTPFPGGDTVECEDGVYYCPVREKSSEIDAGFCRFCPALQTPEAGYISRGASEHRKQAYIDHYFRNYNG